MNKVSLDAIVRDQQAQAAEASSHRSATTVYGGHERMLRQTVIALTAGHALADHENPGEATVHVLSGRVRLVTDDASWEGRTGDLITVPLQTHSLEAIVDSAVLLTVAKSS